MKAIYELENLSGTVRSIDIADRLGVTKASVCVAMKKLKQNNMIEMDGEKNIHLTTDDMKYAKKSPTNIIF